MAKVFNGLSNCVDTLTTIDFTGSESTFPDVDASAAPIPALEKLKVVRLKGKDVVNAVALLTYFKACSGIKDVHFYKCTPDVLNVVTEFPSLECLYFEKRESSTDEALANLFTKRLTRLQVADEVVRVRRGAGGYRSSFSSKSNNAPRISSPIGHTAARFSRPQSATTPKGSAQPAPALQINSVVSHPKGKS